MSLTLTAEEVTALPSAQSLESEFSALAIALTTLRKTAETLTVTDASDLTGMKQARETRIALKEMRCGIEAKRKELKEESLRRGQKIDAAAKKLTAIIEPLESRMLEQETFAQRMEAEKKARLAAERSTLLAGVQMWSLGAADLGSMSETDFQTLYQDAKALHETRVAREAKEREEAIAAEKEREAAAARLREENERLRAEAARREEAIQVEREKQQAAAREAAARADRDRAAAEAEARSQRQAREAAEAKLREAEAAERAKKAAEEKAAADQRAREAAIARRAAQAPDREKLKAYAAAIAAIPIPNVPVPELAGLVKRFVDQIAGLMGAGVDDPDDY